MMLICLKTDEHFILNAVWQSCDFLAAESYCQGLCAKLFAGSG
jgi:hypothetical protein